MPSATVKPSSTRKTRSAPEPEGVSPPPANGPKGERIGYVRVSTVDQSTERQLDGVPVDRIFEDKASGKDVDRPQLQEALRYLRTGDTLVCHSMDRLARNLDDLRRVVRELTGRGVAVEFVKEKQTFTGEDSPMSTLMLSLMGAFAEFERALIRERQREGIALAKARNVYKGRKKELDPARAAELRALDSANGGKGRATLARSFGISRTTLYAYLGATA
jgi:DNA invertase Pin-like site-specific DNA recombinase